MGLYGIRANFGIGDKVKIWCIFIDKYLGDGGRSALALIRILWIVGLASARGLSLVAWQWIYLFAALALLSVRMCCSG